MKAKKDNSRKKAAKRKQGGVEIRDDLKDGSRGKDLSYLSEMPQMGGYEGVVAGVPPPKEKEKENKKGNNLADES